MSIRPVVLNGMIQRTQDVGNLKQQEDNRPIVEQQKENDGYRYDAKEKGNNEYEGESGRHKKRREEEPENEGKVILKGQGSHFDIKI